MHKARAFFFVCAGLFLLALSYHLGSREAAGQSSVVSGANIEVTSGGDVRITCAIGRTFVRMGAGGETGREPAQIPGSSPVAATGVGTNGEAKAVLENGDVYIVVPVGGWVLLGNLAGAATPAQRETWGNVKAKYATPQGKAGQVRGDR